MNTSSFFSGTYAEARAKFLETCAAQGLPVEHHIHPERGREGEELATTLMKNGVPAGPVLTVPEVMEAKAEAFAFASACVAGDALLASTSSTFAVGDLAAMVTHPERFMNAHWLNPAHLLPLVEIARGTLTTSRT